MKHYVCTGECGGVSDIPGVCGITTCSNFDHDLMECNCTDGKHLGALKKCENCGKICEGNCEIDTFKPELGA